MKLEDLPLLACPETLQPLIFRGAQQGNRASDGTLSTPDGAMQYFFKSGIPVLLPKALTQAASSQQMHYEKIAGVYLDVRENLPFTTEYWDYLDGLLTAACHLVDGGSVLEICCGDGAFLKKHFNTAKHRIGIDISPAMLASRPQHADVTLLCADATLLPLVTASVDLVYLHGGVHHIPQRENLFNQIYRVLKAGGRVVFLEPVDDFFVLRWLRKFIYSRSDILDATVEQALITATTRRELSAAGFLGIDVQPCAYLAGGLFANTDVLGFMRHFASLPGHMPIARSLMFLDEVWRHIPIFKRMAMQSIISAQKPLS